MLGSSSDSALRLPRLRTTPVMRKLSESLARSRNSPAAATALISCTANDDGIHLALQSPEMRQESATDFAAVQSSAIVSHRGKTSNAAHT
jgi:hypothetical protein